MSLDHPESSGSSEDSRSKYKLVDFFCGAGGMSCGFAQAGVKILGGIDIEKQFEKTYVENHKGAKFINKDITKYHPEDLEKDLPLQKFDPKLIFIGCSPCQYWSRINSNHKSNQNRYKSSYTNNLLYDFQRFIKHFMPGQIVVENVPGILKEKNNHVLLAFLDFLTFHGYKYKHQIIRTDHYGVPQRRNRFVLIASRLRGEVKFPQPELRDDLTVWNYIGVHNGFAKIPDGHKDETDFRHSTACLSPLNKKRAELTPKDGGTRLAWKDKSELKIQAYENKDHYYISIYGRLHWNKPATTITTRFVATSCGRFTHPEENRGLSLREGATLQTFPYNYKFVGGLVSVAKQIGNAVPPEMARRIALSLISNV